MLRSVREKNTFVLTVQVHHNRIRSERFFTNGARVPYWCMQIVEYDECVSRMLLPYTFIMSRTPFNHTIRYPPLSGRSESHFAYNLQQYSWATAAARSRRFSLMVINNNSYRRVGLHENLGRLLARLNSVNCNNDPGGGGVFFLLT